MPAQMLGTLEEIVSTATKTDNTYKKRANNTLRAFGGVNIIMCGDFWQLEPVSGIFLAPNPLDKATECVHHALNLFWQDGENTIRNSWQLTELTRCDDE